MTTFRGLAAIIENPADRQPVFEWEPYPQAAARDGVPGFEQCFGFVPLLALGGRQDAASLRLGGLYEHIAIRRPAPCSPPRRPTPERPPGQPSAKDRPRASSSS